MLKGLQMMQTKLGYRGGSQEGRMQKDKLYGLRQALKYSYQAATAVISTFDAEGKSVNKEFKCLINPDKLNPEYDNKIISIPYEDVNLLDTESGTQPTNIKPGQVFTWKETNTDWIVYLQYLEEDAYFRADIRRCKHEIEINGHKYKVYVRGPVETKINWGQNKLHTWNNLNYTLSMMVTKNEETLEFFHRFTKIKINGNMWEVQAVNEYDADGIIEIALLEANNNTIEETAAELKADKEEIISVIKGEYEVNPYDTVIYTIEGYSNGSWEVNSKKAQIISQTDTSVEVFINTGRSGEFILSYNADGEKINLPVIIKPF
jgi:hypothetical protein